METLLQDLRYGFRMLRTSPGFTIVAVLTLALGIGANTAVFSVLDAVLLKMIPVQDPAQLVAVGDPSRIGSTSNGTPRLDLFSFPLYRELRDNNHSFSGLFASGDPRRLIVRLQGESGDGEKVNGRLVTANYFSVLGVNPILGRTFTTEEDETRGGAPLVVINYDFWKRRFGLAPDVLGRTVTFNRQPYTIIGVLPKGFDGEITDYVVDVFFPMGMQGQIMPGRDYLDNPNTSALMLMGRLKPGVSVAQAKEDVNLAFKRALEGNYGARLTVDDRTALQKPSNANIIEVTPGGKGFSRLRHSFSQPLVLLMAVVGLVLGCVNTTLVCS